jgi:endoglucanase
MNTEPHNADRMRALGLVAFSILLVAALAPPAAASLQPAALPLAISVQGNHLVNQDGQIVQLRGVNRSGTQYACAEGWGFFDGPSDDASIAAIKSWGVNAVRVNGNEDCWLGINGVKAKYGGANYQAAMGAFVARINAAGMYVIFDLHHSAPGTQLAKGQQPMADADHSPAYWSSVANYFKADPAVLFDLYNEPFPNKNQNTTAAWTCVQKAFGCTGFTYQAAGMQQLLDSVRSTGATNVVMIGGPQYAGDIDRWLEFEANDPLHQLAASIHVYWRTPSNPDWSPCFSRTCWKNVIAPLATQVPVVTGETGEFDCGHSLIDPYMKWADAHGVSYLAWSWIVAGCTTEPSLISSYDGTPTGYGIGVRDHLRSLSSADAGATPDSSATHIVVFVEENHSAKQTIGHMLYLDSMVAGGELATTYSAVAHPSLPNYLAFSSGTTCGKVGSDSLKPTCSKSNIFSQFSDWRVYAESMSAPCSRIGSSAYSDYHNPALLYTNMLGTTVCKARDLPLSSFDAALPSLTFIIPNVQHDMHDGTISQADSFLKTWVPKVLAVAGTEVVVVWDEGTSSNPDPVEAVWFGAGVSAGAYASASTHYSLLAGLEDHFGLARLGAAKTATALPL